MSRPRNLRESVPVIANDAPDRRDARPHARLPGRRWHRPRPARRQYPDGRGQLVAVQGRSGSGKTTLLHPARRPRPPDRRERLVDGAEVTAMSEDELVNLRRHRIGFILQTFGLIPILTAAENVEVPLRLAGADSTHPVRARPGPARPSSASARAPATGRTNSPAASSSASRSRARSPTARPSSSPTSQPASSTRAPPARSCSSCAASSWTKASPSSPPTTPS